MRLSYDDCNDQLLVWEKANAGLIGENIILQKTIFDNEMKIDELETKVRNRNKVIAVLTIYGALSTILNVLK